MSEWNFNEKITEGFSHKKNIISEPQFLDCFFADTIFKCIFLKKGQIWGIW